LLIIRPNNLKFPIYVPITYSSGNKSIILPARSQVVRKIKIESKEDSVLILNQEIEHGIYIANTKSIPFIGLLNTTNTDIVVRINKLNYESLSNYDVV